MKEWFKWFVTNGTFIITLVNWNGTACFFLFGRFFSGSFLSFATSWDCTDCTLFCVLDFFILKPFSCYWNIIRKSSFMSLQYLNNTKNGLSVIDLLFLFYFVYKRVLKYTFENFQTRGWHVLIKLKRSCNENQDDLHIGSSVIVKTLDRRLYRAFQNRVAWQVIQS